MGYEHKITIANERTTISVIFKQAFGSLYFLKDDHGSQGRPDLLARV